jgi:hypothetical protein
MTKLEQLRRKIIESIHGKPYNKAIKNELQDGCKVKYTYCNSLEIYTGLISEVLEFRDGNNYLITDCDIKIAEDEIKEILGLPITIGRVLQALKNKKEKLQNLERRIDNDMAQKLYNISDTVAKIQSFWIIDDKGKELTLDQQDPEVWDKLLELF